DQGFSEMLFRTTSTAFDEDKDMLEAEQRIIGFSPEAPQVDLKGDTGGLQARRMIERQIEEETGLVKAAE
ncbi:MAG: hypothetical protein ACREFQ_16650, partial [Stellaceae bacterium]